MTNFVDEINLEEFEGVEGSTVGLATRKWDYPGIGYNLSKGQLYLDGEKVDELTVTVFAWAQWKNVVVGKGKARRTLASYPIFQKRQEMVKGDSVENRIQIIVMVGDKFYVFGLGSVNGVGAWLKTEATKQYYAPKLPVGILTQLHNHMKRVKAQAGKDIPQYGWQFTIGPAESEIRTGGEYDLEIIPLVRKSGFKFVGSEKFAENEALYLAETLDEWREVRSNPSGTVVSDETGTYEAEDTESGVPPTIEDDEIPF